MTTMILHPTRGVRCAVYTRKSVSDQFEQEYNALEAQRDICAAYVRSQRHRKWVLLDDPYCDDGFSGGTLVRPALQRLLADIERGFVDVVVIYKIDRLTRSLSDFVRLIDQFEQYGVTFVSVTQAFDTQDSMGRLVLNILLTFAQFEREMLADRIRDKLGAMKRAGRWTGGPPPLGYDIVDGRLVVNEVEADIVRDIFSRYVALGSYVALHREMQAAGIRSKAWVNRAGVSVGGGLASRGMTYSILKNRTYVGETSHQGEAYPGLHKPIIDRAVWEEAQAILESRKVDKPPVAPNRNLLLGFLWDGVGRRMKIDAARKRDRGYRYYVSNQNRAALRKGIVRLRAGADDLEGIVKVGLCSFLRDRFAVSGAILSLGFHDDATDTLVNAAPVGARRLEAFDNRRLRLAYEALVERIDVTRELVRIVINCEQLSAFLAWSGAGLFRAKARDRTARASIHVLEIPAKAVRSARTFTLPIEPRPAHTRARPKKGLVDLFALAREVQAMVFENRHMSVEDVGKRFRRKPAFIARVLRLNYLAPDIIAAILDGRQPPGLTRKQLIFASLPMDWAQQRALLGFAEQIDPSPRDVHY